MTITVNRTHKQIPEGTKAEPYEKNGQKLYRFEASSDRYTHVSFSWDYIQNHKQYFNVSKSKRG